MLRIADRNFLESRKAPVDIGYDAFISHATEDKEKLVKPLAMALRKRGFRIWYDQFEMRVGDSLRQSIDRGLASSRFGIVVLSADSEGWRSAFRTDVDHDSEVMPISVPN